MARSRATERPSDAQSLTTEELLTELKARGYVACHESRARMLGIQRMEPDELVERFGDDLVDAVKSDMTRALASKLMDDGITRFRQQAVPSLSSVKFTADLIVILPTEKKTN